ncbi:MAG: hypothetical protein ACSHX9_08415 [Luteolibacter sp.]
MKTLIACFVILCVAVIAGKVQGNRIENLEREYEAKRTKQMMKVSTREDQEEGSSYRMKYERRSAGAKPSEVYETLLSSILNSKSGLSGIGPGADLNQREALQQIIQLDLDGIQALMESVYESQELKKVWPRQHAAANLCMLALVNADPSRALRHALESEGWNKLFNENQIPDGQMVRYILARMAADNPQLALDSMWSLENTTKALNEDWKGQLLKEVAKSDPILALDTIGKLPDAHQQSTLQTSVYGLETTDELAAFFDAARERLSARREQFKWVLSFLFQRSIDPYSPTGGSREWLESLEMTSFEKQLIFDSLKGRFDDHRAIQNPEGLRWFASFMPPNAERDEFLWYGVNTIYGGDPEKAYRLAKEIGIDPEEQIRLEREAYFESGER